MDLKNRAEANGDGHDESVLNPEMPNETDLSKKERRQIEKEKLKGMGTGKKLQYIWMYYKVHMLVVVLAIGAIFLGVSIYRHAKMETVLSISVVNAGNFSSDDVEKDILDLLDTGNKYAEVGISQNLITDETGEDLDYYARIAYVTQIQTATVDVLLMPKELYEHEKDSEVFGNLKEIFGDATFDSLGAADDWHLEVDGGKAAEVFGLSYEPICICVPANIQNKDNALKWIQSIIQ